MEIQQLRYIVAVAEELNFMRAAKKCHVTQPTLSQQVKKIETELGCHFFERSPHGVHLTPAGRQFVPQAISILKQIEQSIAEIAENTDKIKGHLRISAIPTMAPYLLPSIITSLKKIAPDVVLEIYEETTSALVSHLKDGSLDFGILALPVSEAGIVERVFKKEEFLLAVSEHHTLAKKKSITPKMIRDERMYILHEGHCFADQALEYCERNRHDEQVIFQGSSLTSVMKLTETGDGITLVPKMAVERSSGSKLTFIPFSGKKPTRDIGVIWRQTQPLSKAHRVLLDVIGKVLSLMP